jgi:hypothetical protein
VELYALDRVRTVPQTHDQSFSRFGGNLQLIRESGTLNNEAVITVSCKWHREVFKYSLSLVIHKGGFTMHWFWRSHNLATVDLSNGLVTEAYTQCWDVCTKRMYNLAG